MNPTTSTKSAAERLKIFRATERGKPRTIYGVIGHDGELITWTFNLKDAQVAARNWSGVPFDIEVV